jgi:hypothetical protein
LKETYFSLIFTTLNLTKSKWVRLALGQSINASYRNPFWIVVFGLSFLDCPFWIVWSAGATPLRGDIAPTPPFSQIICDCYIKTKYFN